MKGVFPEKVEYGYCHCGCGEKTAIITVNCATRDLVKGEPRRFLKGHSVRLNRRTGKDSPSWRGGRIVYNHRNTSYVRIKLPEHPRSGNNGYVYEHVLVAEKVNGGPLPEGAVVHHVDFDGLNNNEDNLMIFPSSTDHLKFHAKLRRLENEKNRSI